MSHLFQISYLCDHQYNFNIPRFRGEEKFHELAANDRLVSVEQHCPHCQQRNHADVNKRLTYMRRTCNPCQGTDFHYLDCGHYVRCSPHLGCRGDCDYGYLWMSHKYGYFGCRQCILTYFQARAKVEYEDLLDQIASSPEFSNLHHLSRADFFQLTAPTLAPKYFGPLEAALNQYQAELTQNMFFCEPVDVDVFHKEIEMDTLVAELDIGAIDLNDVCSTGRRQGETEMVNDSMVEPEDYEYNLILNDHFWHHPDQAHNRFDQRAAKLRRVRELQDAAREEMNLVQNIRDLRVYVT